MKIIAELCQNHNGDINTLKDMVVKSAESGADIVKIQSIKANSLTKRDEYESFRKYSDEYQRLSSLELSIDDELEFIHTAKANNVTPMTTIFSPNHYDYYNSLGYDYLKLSGYSMREFDYGLKLDKFNFKHLVFSTSSLHLHDIKKCIENLQGVLDIKDMMKQKYGKLSGGQRRRVDIANALINLPELLILDEPTTGLDPQTRQEVWKIIKKIQIEQGITIFLTTHYMEETLESDKVIILDEGKIVAEGTPEELRMKYSTDKLILIPKDKEALLKELKEKNIKYVVDRDRLKVDVKDSMVALDILNSITQYKKFEVIGGSMDDVFINVTNNKKDVICLLYTSDAADE